MCGRECPMHEMEEIQQMILKPYFEDLDEAIKHFAEYMIRLWN